jgi:hypothetical protein
MVPEELLSMHNITGEQKGEQPLSDMMVAIHSDIFIGT